MKTYTAPFIWHRARRIQDRAFVAGILFALAVIGFALQDEARLAVSMAIAGAFALGLSAGAWVIGQRFKQ